MIMNELINPHQNSKCKKCKKAFKDHSSIGFCPMGSKNRGYYWQYSKTEVFEK